MIRKTPPHPTHAPQEPQKKRPVGEPVSLPALRHKPAASLFHLPPEILIDTLLPHVIENGSLYAFSQASRAARSSSIDAASAYLHKNISKQHLKRHAAPGALPSYSFDDARYISTAEDFLQGLSPLASWFKSEIRNRSVRHVSAYILKFRFHPTATAGGALFLNACDISSFPSGLEALPHISRVQLSNNELRRPPQDSRNLPQIRQLELNSTSLVSWPHWLDRFTGLKVIELKNNRIMKLPAQIVVHQSLLHIDLSNNPLQDFPSALLSLKHLTYLNVAQTEIRKLPADIDQLKDLTTLHIQGNHIDRLPDSLGHIENLAYLHIHGNPIRALPLPVLSSSHLQELSVSYFTHFASFAADIRSISSLRHLHLFSIKRTRKPNKLWGLCRPELTVSQLRAPL